MTRGQWHELESTWDAPAATALDQHLYIAEGGSIFRCDRWGAYETMSEDWSPRFLVGVAGSLVTIETGGEMYRIAPGDGRWDPLDDSWSDAIAATAAGDYVYVVERSGHLYRVAPGDGSYVQIGDDHRDVTCMTAAAGHLITFESTGCMYRVSPRTGAWEEIDDDWRNVRCVASDGKLVYAAVGETIFSIDPADGRFEGLNDTYWNTRHLVGTPDALYAIERDGGLWRIELR